MVFKITSIKRLRAKRQAGMTLVELMVTMAISGIVLAALAALIFYTGRSFAAMANYVDLDAKSRHALDTMSREIRQTKRVITGTSTNLVFEDADGLNLEYTYDAGARTLTRIKDGVPDPEPLLTECNSLLFSMYQRNPKSGTYDEHHDATEATCKLIQLKWVCSRDLIVARRNTESVQSAKIVIRKQ